MQKDKMAETFSHDWLEFLRQRAGTLTKDFLDCGNIEAVDNRIHDIEDALSDLIQEDKMSEGSRLLLELSDTYTELMALREDSMFRAGFEEAIRVLRVMGILGGA